jgi:hypothetical protein
MSVGTVAGTTLKEVSIPRALNLCKISKPTRPFICPMVSTEKTDYFQDKCSLRRISTDFLRRSEKSKNRKTWCAMTGQQEKESQNRTSRTGHPEQDSQNRTVRTGGKKMTFRTGQPE